MLHGSLQLRLAGDGTLLTHELWRDIVTPLGALVAFLTYLLGAWRSRQLARADLIHKYSRDFATDDEVTLLFAEIDYDRLSLPNDLQQWLGGSDERVLVRMLDSFNNVGHAVDRKVLRVGDIHGTTLGYAVTRAYKNDAVRAYLNHVDLHDFENLGTGTSFQFFRTLAAELEARSALRRDEIRRHGGPRLLSLRSEGQSASDVLPTDSPAPSSSPVD